MLRAFAASVAVAVIVSFSFTSCTKHATEDQKRVDDLVITVSYSRMPLAKGKNELKIKVKDSSGRPLSKALLETHFYRTGPGDAQANLLMPGELKDGEYTVAPEFAITGDWKLDVTVNRDEGNKPPATATFVFTVK